MDEQPVKSKKSHYILTFVIGISVIGVIIVYIKFYRFSIKLLIVVFSYHKINSPFF